MDNFADFSMQDLSSFQNYIFDPCNLMGMYAASYINNFKEWNRLMNFYGDEKEAYQVMLDNHFNEYKKISQLPLLSPPVSMDFSRREGTGSSRMQKETPNHNLSKVTNPIEDKPKEMDDSNSPAPSANEAGEDPSGDAPNDSSQGSIKNDDDKSKSDSNTSLSKDEPAQTKGKTQLLDILKNYKYEAVKRIKTQCNREHTRTVYICRYGECNKEFLRVWNLLDHLRMHEKVKPFACEHCDKRFTQKGNLKKHEKQHLTPSIDERKKFKCEHCGSSYTERYNYKAHLIKKHGISLPKDK